MDAPAQTGPALLSPDGHWRWDGTQWTPTSAPVRTWPTPAVAPRERSAVAMAAMIVVCIVGGLFVVGVLAAIAIPVFLNQRQATNVRTALQQAAAIEENAAVGGSYVPLDQLQARGLRVAPTVHVAVLRYSATSYCLGAQEGGTVRYYSPATGYSHTPC